MLAWPHLIPGPYSGGDWKVYECEPALACCIPQNRELHVPRVQTAHDGLVRMHEMRHISRDNRAPDGGKWTGDAHRVAMRKMVEEFAIEAEAVARGMDLRQCRDGLDWTTIIVPTEDYQVVQMWLQVAYSVPGTLNDSIKAYWQACHTVLDSAAQAYMLDCYRSLSQDTDYPNCDLWADRLAQRFPPPPPPPPPGLPKQETQAQQQQRAQAQAQEDAAQAQSDREAQQPGAGDDKVTSGAAVEHGRVSVHNHLKLDRTGPTLAAQWRARDSGVVVRYPGRLYPDGRVFGERVRTAAVLVDASSSMSWTEDDTRRLMRGIPGVWCAMYTSMRGRKDGYITRLCIVAAKGRVAKGIETLVHSEPEHSGVNGSTGCDLPALEYAVAHAPKPLVWLSDGAVGGSPDYHRAIEALQARHRIPRIETAQDTIAYLSGRAVNTYQHTATAYDTPKRRRVGQW